MAKGEPEVIEKYFKARTPIEQRLGRPEEIATVVGFVASDDAKWITGQSALVNKMASSASSAGEEEPKEPAFPKIEAATELLEPILLNLSLEDIVVVQRVRKRWHAVITGSSVIQKALFFQPTEDFQLRLVEDRGLKPGVCKDQWDCPGYGALTREFDTSPGAITRWAIDIGDSREYRILVNPVLGVERPWNQIYFPEDNKYKNGDKFQSKAHKRKEASWKNMLFAQPPLQEILAQHRTHFHLVKAKNPSLGLTLGDVHHSRRKFDAEIEMIWGEDGFSRGVPQDSSAYEVLDKLGVEPAPENVDEPEPDPEKEWWEWVEAYVDNYRSLYFNGGSSAAPADAEGEDGEGN
ncbi:hypothetical protein PRZ48_011192 [Zasmidium cellare]|uniref:F-box domain-containing protein n=1 Tax=Zasmidium cellare TaxID=395010 RepID=A0ABR0EAP0_ZASCE|nr:hypothetical protein PRZ48_011192 [Zasmidium cellare]